MEIVLLTYLVLLIALVTAFVVSNHTNERFEQVNDSQIVFVRDARLRSPNLLFKGYGIPVKTKFQSQVQVVFPGLTTEGDVEYTYFWYRLKDIEIVSWNTQENISLQVLQELTPTIKEHLEIESEIAGLEEESRKIKELANLVASSELYAGQVEIHERALVQIGELLRKAKRLQNVYVRLIREALIGVKVAEYSRDRLPSTPMSFDSQYQKVKEDYQQMKDTVDAYLQLLKESRTNK